MPPSPDKRVVLRVSNHKAYVWDVDDIAYLRQTYHVTGTLSGTLPHLSQQNAFLGIPLVLLPEEVVLLVEIGAASLTDDHTAHTHPFLRHVQEWNADQERDMRLQLELLKTKVSEQAEIHTKKKDRGDSEEAQRKMKAREEKRAKAAGLKREEEEENAAATSVVESPPSHSTFSPTITTPYTITIPGSSSSLSWYTPSDSNTYHTLQDAREAGIWSYPSTLPERAKCAVFRDLWEKGYWMGGGIKFGGDWLVYPGDPLRYHSHFTATVVPFLSSSSSSTSATQASSQPEPQTGTSAGLPTGFLRPMEIVAHGRLGTATKKSHLMCGWAPGTEKEGGGVRYLSIEWAGFG